MIRDESENLNNHNLQHESCLSTCLRCQKKCISCKKKNNLEPSWTISCVACVLKTIFCFSGATNGK